MSDGWLPLRRLSDKLGFRFAFLITLALVPLGLISLIQTRDLALVATQRSEAALSGATLRAASAVSRAIEEARGAALSLAPAIPQVASETRACSRLLAAVGAQMPQASLIAYIRLDGVMECSSVGTTFDFSDNAVFAAIRERGEGHFFVNPEGPVSGTAIIGVAQPVPTESGGIAGYVTISIPHHALAVPVSRPAGADTEPIALVTFDAAGQILTSSVGLGAVQAQLPRDRALRALAGPDSLTFTAHATAGEERTYALVPLIPGEIFALGSWQPQPTGLVAELSGGPLVFPLLMLAASVVVAWLGAEMLVLRYVRILRRAITSFASGTRIVGELDFAGAPAELREAADAFEQMTDSILHDEAELEDIIHQKEVLLREVHHRVKNNLQLIASIMNMQIRQARTAETKELMRGLQDRVMSLATIHRELYQTSGLTDVRADELFSDIVRQLLNMSSGPGRQFKVDTDFEDFRVTPDQAVPLALLATEAITNAMKYAGAPHGATPSLRVSLRRKGPDHAVLEVVNSVQDEHLAAAASADPGVSLGSQLLAAFVQQLNGEMLTEVVGHAYTLRATFPLQPLEEGEEGRTHRGVSAL
jgi:two-component system, sensor histidine kinase PdtaS